MKLSLSVNFSFTKINKYWSDQVDKLDISISFKWEKNDKNNNYEILKNNSIKYYIEHENFSVQNLNISSKILIKGIKIDAGICNRLRFELKSSNKIEFESMIVVDSSNNIYFFNDISHTSVHHNLLNECDKLMICVKVRLFLCF